MDDQPFFPSSSSDEDDQENPYINGDYDDNEPDDVINYFGTAAQPWVTSQSHLPPYLQAIEAEVVHYPDYSSPIFVPISKVVASQVITRFLHAAQLTAKAENQNSPPLAEQLQSHLLAMPLVRLPYCL